MPRSRPPSSGSGAPDRRGPGAGAVWLPHYTADSLPTALLPEVQPVTDSGGSCVWLLTRDNERIAALWPPDYRARFHPLRIYDEKDALVWSEQQRRDVGGGYSSVHVERLPAACRTGPRAWWVRPLQPTG